MKALISVLLALAITAPLFGASIFDRDFVLMETNRDLWGYRTDWQYAVSSGGNLLIHVEVPYARPQGRFFVASPNQILFHYNGTMYVWDGVHRLAGSGQTGYAPIFESGAPMTEIAPRGGSFLVGGPALIEFNPRRRLAEYPLPEGHVAAHIEVLADRCTVLYTTAGDRGVHRYNVCTRQPESDFATLLFEGAGAIRALPNGDVLVANTAGVLRYTPGGTLLRMYDAPGATHIALNHDGTEFWAAGAVDGDSLLLRFDLNEPAAEQNVPLGNPGMQSLDVPESVNDLVVGGEWRAAAPRLRMRTIRR